jgi:hypothetical protein
LPLAHGTWHTLSSHDDRNLNLRSGMHGGCCINKG